jgi:RES domain-containing protein
VARTVVWRIARRPYALDRLGAGARQEGGRWNYPGTAVIDTACSIALAALEKFVHAEGIVPPDLVLVRVELPKRHTAERADPRDLPKGWSSVPPGPASMSFGTQWARAGRSLVLYVPSALVPEETNALLNPSHAEFGQVKMAIERDFHYDPRMYRPRTTRRP